MTRTVGHLDEDARQIELPWTLRRHLSDTSILSAGVTMVSAEIDKPP